MPPYTAHHAFSLFDLPPHHQDPQIIAQALCEKIPVVTCDAYDYSKVMGEEIKVG